VKTNPLRDDGDIQFTTKQKDTKINSVFITFHPNDKSKTIFIQPLITNFELIAEDVGARIYPAGGIIMNTWNDLTQYQMFMDALNFSDNSIVGLHIKFLIAITW
jgi:hypothetical protein